MVVDGDNGAKMQSRGCAGISDGASALRPSNLLISCQNESLPRSFEKMSSLSCSCVSPLVYLYVRNIYLTEPADLPPGNARWQRSTELLQWQRICLSCRQALREGESRGQGAQARVNALPSFFTISASFCAFIHTFASICACSGFPS